jgi:hypothetical protein
LIQPLPDKWVDEIFKRLHGRFGNRFISDYSAGIVGSDGEDKGISNAKKIWAEELSGFTPEEIKRGLTTVYQFPPSCDSFKLACRPSVDYEQAFVEAVEQMQLRNQGKDQWTSAAVYWAAVELGNDLSNYPYQSIKGRWKSAFDKAKEKIWKGSLPNTVPVRLTALPSPGQSTVSKEEAQKRFAEVYKILGKKVVK